MERGVVCVSVCFVRVCGCAWHRISAGTGEALPAARSKDCVAMEQKTGGRGGRQGDRIVWKPWSLASLVTCGEASGLGRFQDMYADKTRNTQDDSAGERRKLASKKTHGTPSVRFGNRVKRFLPLLAF